MRVQGKIYIFTARLVLTEQAVSNIKNRHIYSLAEDIAYGYLSSADEITRAHFSFSFGNDL